MQMSLALPVVALTLGPILQEWFGWYLPCSLGADTLVALSILIVNDHVDGWDLRTAGGL